MTSTLFERARVVVARPSSRSRPRAVVRGRETDPVWVRPALLSLFAVTAVLYLWNLSASGWGNSFYSAAVQAGSHSWKAFFFGSSDAANSITVDKTPASLWVMEIAARIFGVNSWSILAPQAIEGVAAVGLLYLAVRRRFSAAAGLLAGAVFALTPVAALMFRFNNPDALLTLLLIGGAYALLRATETARTSWLVVAGTCVGFGFLTKMLQALIVAPVFAVVYLVAAPTSVRRRIVQLLAAGAAMVVSAGWWIAIVALWPASSRPYIGGSQHNSILELTLGYNGFGRLTGNENGSVGGGGAGGGSRWGATGLTRLFGSEMGGQISWLIPAALILFVACLWLLRRAPRTDLRRATLLLFGGWLVLTGLVFSFAKGIIHPYYNVVLAPAIGALVGIGAVSLWRSRERWVARIVLAATLAVTCVWAAVLLHRTPNWHPALRTWILVIGLACAALIVAGRPMSRWVAAMLATVSVVVGLAAPTAYALATVNNPHAGAIPSAGPAGAGSGFPGGGPGGGPGRFRAGGPPAAAIGGGPGGPGGLGGGRGGVGGLLDAGTPNTALTSLLTQNASQYTWIAATVGANSAAGIQLATGHAVMPIGGFNGTDPSPTLAQFQAFVAAGKIHYFIAGGGMGRGPGGGGAGTSSQITSWVESTFTATSVGGTTVYDLTSAATSSNGTVNG
jgi:4-amino-4-deoxy-L-arabinose transferase-like glycosyltransferase